MQINPKYRPLGALAPRRLRPGLAVLALLGLLAVSPRAEDAIYQRAFPDPIPTDADFQTVVEAQPQYSKLRYPVPIIGWKHHPEEIHVTPEGALVLPAPRTPAPLYLTPLLAIGAQPPRLLDPDAVATSLVDGYKPGVQSAWKTGGLRIDQFAFGSLLEGREVRTGKEVLLGLVRFTLSNESAGPVSGSFLLNFGKGAAGLNHKQAPPPYPSSLAYAGRFIQEANGDIAACLLSCTLGNATFTPARPKQETNSFVILNSDESTISKPEYVFEVTRSGESITVGTWHSEEGLDLYFEASSKHSSPGIAEIEVIDSNNQATRLGFIGKHGFAPDLPPAAEFVKPGDHTAPLTWARLRGAIPQGVSRLSLRPYYLSPTGPAKAWAWEPLVHLTKQGFVPSFSSQGGADKNNLEVAFTLAPGDSKSLEIAVPYFPLPAAQGTALLGLAVNARLAEFRGYWERELNRNAQFIIPEPRLRNAYRAWLAYNLMLVDRDPATGFLLPHPDPTAYEAVWAGDASVMMQSMDRMGYHQEVADYAKYFISRQGKRQPDGDADTADGFFPGDVGLRWLSENGFVLWALCEHYKLSGDAAWLAAQAPKLIASANWIARQRERTKKLVNGEKPRHWGLMVQGRPSDLGDWDYWYFTDAYSCLGLREAAEVLTEAGFTNEAPRLAAAAADYRQCLLRSLDQSINRQVNPPFVPLTPYKNENPTADYLYRYWYHLASPIYLVEAGIFDARDERATWINAWVEKLGMVSGLCKFQPEVIDPHYIYNQALTQLLRGETDKFVWTLYSLYAYGQSRETYATMEWANIRTGIKETETWDDCRQPHLHSNSRCLAMLRIALLLEEETKLHLMMGTPRGWLEDGQRIEVRHAPSSFGEVSYVAESKLAAGEIDVRLNPPGRKSARVLLHLRPPSKYGRIRSVTVNDQPWTQFTADTVDLGTPANPAHVVCRFQ